MKKTLVLTMLLALAIASVAVAQQPGQQGPQGQRGWGECPNDGPGPRMEGRMGFRGHGMGFGQGHDMPGIQRILAFGDELKLTDEQRDKLEEMAVGFQMARVDQKAKLEKAEINLRSVMMDDAAAESAVMTAIDQVAGLKAEMQKMHYRHFQQAKSVLTAEQIDQLKDMRRGLRRGQAGGRQG